MPRGRLTRRCGGRVGSEWLANISACRKGGSSDGAGEYQRVMKDEERRPRGRPRLYADRAEQARAYRARKASELERLRAQAAELRRRITGRAPESAAEAGE